jgi:Family of unknown function (DUF5333)
MSHPRMQQSDVQARDSLRLPVALLRRAGFLGLALTLGACVAETPSVALAPPQGASAERALQEFVIIIATVDLIDGRCRATGLGKTYSDPGGLIDRYVVGMQAQGYSLPEIERALDGLSTDAMAIKALERVEARGVEIGNDASLCRFGRAEVARGSAVGSLLKVSS